MLTVLPSHAYCAVLLTHAYRVAEPCLYPIETSKIHAATRVLACIHGYTTDRKTYVRRLNGDERLVVAAAERRHRLVASIAMCTDLCAEVPCSQPAAHRMNSETRARFKNEHGTWRDRAPAAQRGRRSEGCEGALFHPHHRPERCARRS